MLRRLGREAKRGYLKGMNDEKLEVIGQMFKEYCEIAYNAVFHGWRFKLYSLGDIYLKKVEKKKRDKRVNQFLPGYDVEISLYFKDEDIYKFYPERKQREKLDEIKYTDKILDILDHGDK